MAEDQSVKSSIESPLHRPFVYLTAAITGGAILGVEIIGARMLGPYFGTSHFVWTAQIAITLVALATGYSLGGWMITRSKDLFWIYGGIFTAAAYLCSIVSCVRPIGFVLLRYDLAVATVVASFILFFIPLTLLAAVGPCAVHVLAIDVSRIGRTVGRLSAVSTGGSVLGVIAVSYWLGAQVANATVVVLISVVLFGLAVVYCALFRRRWAVASIASVLAAILAGFGSNAIRQELDVAVPNVVELARSNSHFGLLQVWEVKGTSRRLFLTDLLTQNVYDASEKKSMAMFTYALHGLAHAYLEQPKDLLCIGLGVGLVPMEFARAGANVDVVEINPAIVPLAIQYFDLDTNRINLFINDGRPFLNDPSKRYDCIIVDAFLGDSAPSHLLSVEAFAAAKNALNDDGILVLHTPGRLGGSGAFAVGSIARTLGSVFRNVRIHSTRVGSIFYVASGRADLSITAPPHYENVPIPLRDHVKRCVERTLDPEFIKEGIVLTDDFNPLDFYDAPNREIFRRNLVIYTQRL